MRWECSSDIQHLNSMFQGPGFNSQHQKIKNKNKNTLSVCFIIPKVVPALKKVINCRAPKQVFLNPSKIATEVRNFIVDYHHMWVTFIEFQKELTCKLIHSPSWWLKCLLCDDIIIPHRNKPCLCPMLPATRLAQEALLGLLEQIIDVSQCSCPRKSTFQHVNHCKALWSHAHFGRWSSMMVAVAPLSLPIFVGQPSLTGKCC